MIIGVLCTIFFHRFLSPFRPKTHDIFDLTLPAFDDRELDILIEERVAALLRSIEASSSSSSSPSSPAIPTTTSARGQLAVQFHEKRPRRAGWFSKAEEKVCWEQWLLNVTIISPRTEAGTSHPDMHFSPRLFMVVLICATDRAKARRQIEDQLQATVLKIITVVGNEKNHIPPITSNDANPFPYTIVVSPKGETWGARMGIF